MKTKKQKMEGEFYTPTIWANEAHKMISEEFGEDWKEDYIVWDPACGTGNLTRDYKFKELYCSTLNQSDIDIMDQSGCNPEATKFQFDFLNDNDRKLPEGLQNALKEGKKIIFLMNPPYGAAGSGGSDTEHKTGIAETKIAQKMKQDKIGGPCQQLYAQFFYKTMQYNKQGNINIGTFTKPLFLTGPSYKEFRRSFLSQFAYQSGMLFNAGHFSNVSKVWGINFSIWRSGQTNDVNNFSHVVKENILDKGTEKVLYNLDRGVTTSKWVREEVKGLKTHDAPQMTSGLNIKTTGKTMRGRLVKNSLGYSTSVSNNVLENTSGVYLTSSAGSRGLGFSIIPENFNKIIALFTARKSIQQNWINDKDEYMAPTDHPEYEQWNNDCLVYSLFNTSSSQSSMRQVDYKEKLWDIKNEFFWMSKDEMQDLANEYCNDAVYQDCIHADDRFVFNRLKDTHLSGDAQEILNLASELVKKSFVMRIVLQNSNPEYHLNCWDAGWYQIKKILKEYYLTDLKAFTVKYKKFENRMRDGVYKFRFLK